MTRCIQKFAVLFVALFAATGRAGEVRVTQAHMGLAVTLTIHAPTAADEAAAKVAARRAFERVAELDAILSDWNPRSELNDLCRRAGDGPQKISAELHVVLTEAKKLAEASGGLYDPTAAPLVRLWREARRTGELPSDEAIEAARSLVGWSDLILGDGTAELRRPGMQLDLGGIAKGYVGDEAIRVLRDLGFPRAAYEAGGDVVVGDAPPGAEGWRVEPEGLEPILVKSEAVAISGDSVQFAIIDGVRYGHVVDPRTGRPTEARRSCLVRSPRGIDADALATLGTIMGAEAFAQLIEARGSGTTASVAFGNVPEP